MDGILVVRTPITRPTNHWSLKKLAERYPKVVKRASDFDWLSFSDLQVWEASRCYLYGFFRAAVLVAASALEDRLKTVACVTEFNSYDNLTDSAFGVAGAPRWTSENRPFLDTAKPAISGVAIETSGVLLRRRLGTQVGLDLRAPAARSALEHVRMMEQPIE